MKNIGLLDTYVEKLDAKIFAVFKEHKQQSFFNQRVFIGIVTLYEGVMSFSNKDKLSYNWKANSLFKLDYSDKKILNLLEKLDLLEPLFLTKTRKEFNTLVEKVKKEVKIYGTGIHDVECNHEEIVITGYEEEGDCQYQAFGSISRSELEKCRKLTSLYDRSRYQDLAELAVGIYIKMSSSS